MELILERDHIHSMNVWTTARGFATWCKKSIPEYHGKTVRGESYRLNTEWDEANRRPYVSLLVYGSGPIKVDYQDIDWFNKYFRKAGSKQLKGGE